MLYGSGDGAHLASAAGVGRRCPARLLGALVGFDVGGLERVKHQA